MKKPILFVILISAILVGFKTEDSNNDLVGVWLRIDDHLSIEVKEESADRLNSFILKEGTENFPCDVTTYPIYKNISKAGRNLWRCEFLVVTLGTCTTDYEDGMIQLTPEGRMEITCPGYSKKIYTKKNPRYQSKD